MTTRTGLAPQAEKLPLILATVAVVAVVGSLWAAGVFSPAKQCQAPYVCQ